MCSSPGAARRGVVWHGGGAVAGEGEGVSWYSMCVMVGGVWWGWYDG